MSEKNKDILRQANAAIVKGDYEGFLAHCTDDTLWTFVGDITLNGKQAVRDYMKATYLEPPKFSVERMIADDEFVTAIGNIDLRNANGDVVHHAYCDVWRVRDGKLAQLSAYVVQLKS